MSADKQKILIVDNTPVNIQILNEALKDDYEIYFAMNGKDALQTAQTVIPDLKVGNSWRVLQTELNKFLKSGQQRSKGENDRRKSPIR